MGADLYIEEIYRPQYENHQPAFEAAVKKRDALPEGKARDKAQREVDRHYDAMYAKGYYRDSYNASGVLHRLGLSWWQDVGPMLNEDGNLMGESLRDFLAMVEERQLRLPTAEELKADHAKVDEDKNSVNTWHNYYIAKHKKLIAFLKLALNRNLPIRCSI